MSRIALTLGPVFFHWPADQLADFYRRIADEASIDRVHVGEVVCGKRMPFSDPGWPDIIERLERGGHQLPASGLAIGVSGPSPVNVISTSPSAVYSPPAGAHVGMALPSYASGRPSRFMYRRCTRLASP